MSMKLPSPMVGFQWPDDLATLNKHNASRNIRIFCKRDDLIHPVVSGNKWRKLSPSIDFINDQGVKRVLSFGGAYSNHLHALGFVCQQHGIELIACIRGDYSKQITPMLADLKNWGVQISFMTKSDYKHRNNPDFCNTLAMQHDADFIIPEGGSNEHCLIGVEKMYAECLAQQRDFTHLILPVASGGTMAGLIRAQWNNNHNDQFDLCTPTNLNCSQKIIGIAMLKGEHYLESLVTDLLAHDTDLPNPLKEVNWEILHNFHHGGYAKTSTELSSFVDSFNTANNNIEASTQETMLIEPVYSGKTFFALKHLCETDYFAENSTIIVVHTGGLQGMRPRTHSASLSA